MSDDAIRARIVDLIGDGGAEAAELVGRIVASFLTRAPDMIDKFGTAAAAGDATDAAHWAHALAGAAGNVGATGLARIAAAAEEEALAGDLTFQRDVLDAAFTQVQADLTAVLHDLAPVPTTPR
jgi:HPt (histidine-containing phosphotransfer) domain-containing protein